MTYHRRRGTAIVETPRGILVCASRNKLFMLPGGGANKGESRKRATIRELHEETGLKTISCKFLFSFRGSKHHSYSGKSFRDMHKIFLIKAEGHPLPNYHDVSHIDYWKPNSRVNISRTTRIIIEKYINEFKKTSP